MSELTCTIILHGNDATAHAKSFEDKCVPEELVRGAQAVETSVDSTSRIFFATQHYLHQIGLEVHDGCTMPKPKGHTMWFEINQDCMRTKRREATQNALDKDAWRAGGSAAKATIRDKQTLLNALLGADFTRRAVHQYEMLVPCSRLCRRTCGS